jgi:hypothetical protein
MAERVESLPATAPVRVAYPGEVLPDGSRIANDGWGLVLIGPGGCDVVIEGSRFELDAFRLAVTVAMRTIVAECAL